MGGIDRGVDIESDDKPGEEIDEDDEVPADMVDEELCPVTSPHEVSLPYTVLWSFEG